MSILWLRILLTTAPKGKAGIHLSWAQLLVPQAAASPSQLPAKQQSLCVTTVPSILAQSLARNEWSFIPLGQTSEPIARSQAFSPAAISTQSAQAFLPPPQTFFSGRTRSPAQQRSPPAGSIVAAVSVSVLCLWFLHWWWRCSIWELWRRRRRHWQ